jgi:GT2 family glycosyltransferase
MDLSIICVNWNSLEYLTDCIASIYENTHGVTFEVIVVDNASPEQGVETLKNTFCDLIIIESSENLGFARANNLGFTHSSGRYVLLLNPDTRIVGPAINTLLDSAKSLPDAGIVGGKLLNTDLTIQTAAIQKFPTIVNQLITAEYFRLLWPGCPLWNIAPLFSRNGRPVRVEVIPGACMLLRSEHFAKVGMFSEDYFMYGEDLDLNWKMKALGYSNYYIEDAEIVHHGGKSSSRQKISNWSTIMEYRAMLRYYYKNHSRLYGSAYRASTAAVAMTRLIILAILFPFKGDKQLLRIASAKWSAVLMWAIGMRDLTVASGKG